MPLAVAAIFDGISRTQDREFLSRVSYMEVCTLPCADRMVFKFCMSTHTQSSTCVNCPGALGKFWRDLNTNISLQNVYLPPLRHTMRVCPTGLGFCARSLNVSELRF